MASLIGRLAGLRDDRGAELIEFALILPVLLLVFGGIVDFGFLFKDYEVVTNAAREGARLGTLPGYSLTTDVPARVQAYIASGGLDLSKLTVPAPQNVTITLATGTVQAVKVDVSYSHQYLILGPIAQIFGGSFGSVSLKASSTMRREVPAS